MSSQKGNVKKTGAPKHQNVRAFKNDLHDKSKKMQTIKSLNLGGICQRCKEKIEWKIKYRKYKPLTVPRKCVSCSERSIKQAYYTLCSSCASARNVCAKCGEKKEIVSTSTLSPAEQAIQDSQLKKELEMLPERKRRTFFRLQAQGKLCDLGSRGDEYSDDSAAESDHHDNSDSDSEQNCSAKSSNVNSVVKKDVITHCEGNNENGDTGQNSTLQNGSDKLCVCETASTLVQQL